MEDRYAPGFDRHLLHCGYEFSHTDPARGEGLPYFPDLDDELKKRGDWYVLFPNFAFEVFPDQVAVFIAEPTGPTTCREHIALYFVDEGARSEKYAEPRQRVIENWRELNQEDVGVVERMQTGRNSDVFQGGVLSPFWDPVQQHFAKLLVDAVNSPVK